MTEPLFWLQKYCSLNQPPNPLQIPNSNGIIVNYRDTANSNVQHWTYSLHSYHKRGIPPLFASLLRSTPHDLPVRNLGHPHLFSLSKGPAVLLLCFFFHTCFALPLPSFFFRHWASLALGLLQWSTTCSHSLCQQYWSSLIHLPHAMIQAYFTFNLKISGWQPSLFEYAELGYHKYPCEHCPSPCLRSCRKTACCKYFINLDSNQWSSLHHLFSPRSPMPNTDQTVFLHHAKCWPSAWMDPTAS